MTKSSTADSQDERARQTPCTACDLRTISKPCVAKPNAAGGITVALSTRWLRRAAEVDQDSIDRGPSDAKQVAGRRKPWPRRGACPLNPEQADPPDASAVVE